MVVDNSKNADKRDGKRPAPFGVGVEYALHCLLYLIDVPGGRNLGIHEIATFQGVSETYLSKIFTRLKRAGIVRSAPGVKGGYELARAASEITFWDVVTAVEGPVTLFHCRNVRFACILDRGKDVSEARSGSICAIHAVMLEAELKIRTFLQEKTLLWLHEHVQSTLPRERTTAIAGWFAEALGS